MKKPSKVEEVDLSQSLSGREGVDPNHASRIRVQTLLDQHASLVQQTQFADTKSAGLVTLIGLLALKGPVPIAAMNMADPVSVMSSALSGLCILFCVLTVFPRYPARKVRKTLAEVDRFSWPALTATGYDAEEFAEYMHLAEVSQIVHSIAHSNSAVAHILLRKYQMLRVAFVFGALNVLLVFTRAIAMI